MTMEPSVKSTKKYSKKLLLNRTKTFAGLFTELLFVVSIMFRTMWKSLILQIFFYNLDYSRFVAKLVQHLFMKT